ncbi:MAG TPA: hypothetical protein PK070_04535 [Synergistaceae bacterium]|jgi:hypothetical protein|nr:hypothetical protein [Synergistaceae bacterium]HQA54790.1 hypothetical protein [Synergistaceae bacterium]
MRLLIFLLLGTLIFGFAFPAVILVAGLAGMVIFAMIIAGLLRGGGVRIYTSGSRGPFAREVYREEGPDVIDTEDIRVDPVFSENGQDDADEEEEGEIIELPATALRKDESKEP